jgi:hypothetical protein
MEAMFADAVAPESLPISAVAMDTMREELTLMKPVHLKQRARELGVSEDKIQALDEVDDVKAAAVELVLVTMLATSGSVAQSTATQENPKAQEEPEEEPPEHNSHQSEQHSSHQTEQEHGRENVDDEEEHDKEDAEEDKEEGEEGDEQQGKNEQSEQQENDQAQEDQEAPSDSGSSSSGSGSDSSAGSAANQQRAAVREWMDSATRNSTYMQGLLQNGVPASLGGNQQVPPSLSTINVNGSQTPRVHFATEQRTQSVKRQMSLKHPVSSARKMGGSAKSFLAGRRRHRLSGGDTTRTLFNL